MSTSWTNLLAILSATLAATGLCLNWWQMRKNNMQRRAEYLVNMRNKYMSDPEMLEIHYQIEYSKFEYKEFHGSPTERKLDKLLYFYESVARLRLMKNITDDDIGMFAYELLSVYRNEEVKKYLSFLDDSFAKRGFKLTPFRAFRQVGEQLKGQVCTVSVIKQESLE